jgi:CubicO group peptidase (beta-lactamase class C family)
MSLDFSSLEGFILEKMRETKIPGLSLAVIENGETVYSRGFGFSDISSGLQATDRTLYGIGSVTKSFTALAIMQLIEQGKVQLNDPIEKYVPLKLKPFGESVSIHHLLTHSSGLPDLGYASAFIGGVLGWDNSWLPVSGPEDVIAFMHDANEWAVTRPGERFFYLNEGYVLLGYIISKLTGVTYEQYVQERILQPLRMDRTFFSKADVERDADKATPYIIDKEGKHLPSSFPYGINSDGGLISNAHDLSNYLKMCLNRGEFEGQTIVSRETFESMEIPYIPEPLELFGKESYGYGWGITPDFCGYKLVRHGGSVGVYSAYVGYVPEGRRGVATLSNADGLGASIGLYALSQSVGQDPKTLPFLKTERILRRLEGQYETYKGTIKITFKEAGGVLYLDYKDRYREQRTPFFPEKLEDDLATFYVIAGGVRATIEFKMKDGKVEMIDSRAKWIKKI